MKTLFPPPPCGEVEKYERSEYFSGGGPCVPRAILAALFLLATAATTPTTAACLKYEPQIVTLSGTLIITPFKSPTGETINQPVLKLVTPLCVDGRPKAAYDSKSEKNVREIQMVYADYPFGARWHDQQVTVTGKLFHGFAPLHHTPVLILVKTTKVTK